MMTTEPTTATPANRTQEEIEDQTGDERVYGEDGGDDDEDDEDDEIDAEAEAEAIARRLGDQLWASINKAQAEGAASTVTQNSLSPALSATSTVRRDEAALQTMKTIIASVDKDPLARSVFATTVVQECDGRSILEVLNQTVAAGRISKDVARPLSSLLITLARSEVLFASTNATAPVTQPDQGKRKRTDTDGTDQDTSRASRRLYPALHDLQTQVTEAVRTVANVLNTNDTCDAPVISSIQLQLHQIFLFAVTSSARGGLEMSALRELSGLIQVLGVLNGIQITAAPRLPAGQPPPPQLLPYHSQSSWVGPLATDIGTAVYPCLVSPCRKLFSRLYTLRAHQRFHTTHRPFRCSSCTASFTRNHDLRRHAKLHEKRAWKCGGCGKMFSRRDAIKRHQENGSKKRPGTEQCLNQEVIEVDTDKEGGEEVENKRARLWSGGSSTSFAYDEKAIEDGEISSDVISRLQAVALTLSGPLRKHIRQAIEKSSGDTLATSAVGPPDGQMTLASIIAQAQNHPAASSGGATASLFADRDHLTAAAGPGPQVSSSVSQDEGSSSSPTDVPLAAYGLSEEQTKMLQRAIANAASAAQAQAEAEAELEESSDCEADNDDDDDDESGAEGPEG